MGNDNSMNPACLDRHAGLTGNVFSARRGLQDACGLRLAACGLRLAACGLRHQWDWLMRDGTGVDMGILMSSQVSSDARSAHQFLCRSYHYVAANSQSRGHCTIIMQDLSTATARNGTGLKFLYKESGDSCAFDAGEAAARYAVPRLQEEPWLVVSGATVYAHGERRTAEPCAARMRAAKKGARDTCRFVPARLFY